ncbi:MAG: metalloregulator ArsR/SmtB family transcription factor [Candidatus Paceibacterota bacterium]
MKNEILKKKTKSQNKQLQAISFLRIIAEKNRLKILQLLHDKEKCVCEIWRYLDIPQNLASHHLKALSDFGLIQKRKEGLKVFYSLDKNNLEKNLDLLKKIFKC